MIGIRVGKLELKTAQLGTQGGISIFRNLFFWKGRSHFLGARDILLKNKSCWSALWWTIRKVISLTYFFLDRILAPNFLSFLMAVSFSEDLWDVLAHENPGLYKEPGAVRGARGCHWEKWSITVRQRQDSVKFTGSNVSAFICTQLLKIHK